MRYDYNYLLNPNPDHPPQLLSPSLYEVGGYLRYTPRQRFPLVKRIRYRKKITSNPTKLEIARC